MYVNLRAKFGPTYTRQLDGTLNWICSIAGRVLQSHLLACSTFKSRVVNWFVNPKKHHRGHCFELNSLAKDLQLAISLKLLRQLDKTHLPQPSVIPPEILSCSAKTRKIKCKQISNFWVKWTKIVSQSWDNLGYKRRQLHPLGNIHFTLQKKQEKCSGKNSHWNSLNLSPRCRSFE